MSPKKDKKKKKNDKEKKSGAAGLTPLLTAAGPSDALVLNLTWEGGEARLMALSDNGGNVTLGEKQGTGDGGLTVRWNSPDAFSHVLKWDLVFKGKRTDLKATATVNGAGEFEDPVEADSKEDRWKAAGTVEE